MTVPAASVCVCVPVRVCACWGEHSSRLGLGLGLGRINSPKSLSLGCLAGRAGPTDPAEAAVLRELTSPVLTLGCFF